MQVTMLKRSLWLCAISCLCYGVNILAEVITDGSVGENITLQGPKYTIEAELGKKTGTNLFHSFSHFNLTENEEAIFTGSGDIDNVINRVTKQSSHIDGRIHSKIEGANFYFINPAGIVFGPHAQIDVDGSLYFSTADYLKLGDIHYSATEPQHSQFTTAAPEAFGFLDNTIAEIRKEPMASVDNIFIRVPVGKNINFVGGNITFIEAPDNAEAEQNLVPTLQVQDGSIHLISTAIAGEIPVSLPAGNTAVIEQGGVIRIVDTPIASQNHIQQPHIQIIGERDGRVVIQARNIVLQGIYVFADTEGLGKDKEINLLATDAIVLTGGSHLTTETTSTSEESSGGTIRINAPQVILNKGAKLETTTTGRSRAGNIVITAPESLTLSGQFILIDGEESLTVSSSLLTKSDGLASEGQAGEIIVNTANFRITSGKINADTMGIGNGGKINITANELVLSKNGEITATKGEFGSAKAGDIHLNVNKLEMTDSKITTDTQGSTGGNISLTASDYIYLKNNSELTTSAKDTGTIGDGGHINLNVNAIVLNHGRIEAQAKQGIGGDIKVTTKGIFNFTDTPLEQAINADSEHGINGTVEINSPTQNMLKQLALLSYKLFSEDELLKRLCQTKNTQLSTLWYQAAPEGVPSGPDDWLASEVDLTIDTDDLSPRLKARIQTGLQAVRNGNFVNAAQIWRGILDGEKRFDNKVVWGEIKRIAAYTYQQLGYYYAAFRHLDEAYLALETTDERQKEAQLLSQFSDFWLAVGQVKTAEQQARQASELATDIPAIKASALNHLGNALVVQTQYEAALEKYAQAMVLAQQADKPILHAQIAINRLNARFSFEESVELGAALQQLSVKVNTLPAGYAQQMLWLALGELAYQAGRKYADTKLIQAAQTWWLQVVQSSTTQSRNYAWAHGWLGESYEQQKQFTKAQQHTRLAIWAMQTHVAPDLAYRWWWQMGRIYRAQGDNAEKALQAYRQAVVILKPIQTSVDVGYRNPRQTFKKLIRPVYYELVDLLLQQAEQNEAEKQTLLVEVQQYLEDLRVEEMQDYFQDDCIQRTKERNLQKNTKLAPHTATLYPIPLPDRLVLLIQIQAKRDVIEVSATSSKALEKEVKALQIWLQAPMYERFRSPAKKLYDWLIRPLQPIFMKHDIHQLVVVADGWLRTIPFAALLDDKQFLVEQYILTLSPRFSSREPSEKPNMPQHLLIAGLSLAVKGHPPLQNVNEEIKAIEKIEKNNKTAFFTLQDEKFTRQNFVKHLRGGKYTAVHLATHGSFNSDPALTYLLAYNEKLRLPQLREWFAGQKLDLLTLSACQTAKGDERTALGLAGMAFDSGVDSVLASLWNINDDATAELMTEFYQQWPKAKDKAAALQYAQQTLLKNPRYAHPAYWAAFVLVGE